MVSKGTWGGWSWNYLKSPSSPEVPAGSAAAAPSTSATNPGTKPIQTTQATGTNDSNAPRRSPTETKMKSQRAKQISQVRRVAKPAPQLSLSSRSAAMLSLSKELFLALRYVPAGILSRLPSIPGNNLRQDSSSDMHHSQVNFIAKSTEGGRGGYEDKNGSRDGVVLAASTSGSTQSGGSGSTATAGNMGSKLDLIRPPRMTTAYPDGNRQNLSSSTVNPVNTFSLSKLFEGTLFKKQQKILTHVTTRDADLSRQHLEARTRYLVSSINKNIGAENPVHLLQLLDTLFQHIYQNIETREIAVDSGANKILAKISNMYESHEPVVNRTRQLLAIIGHNPPTKGSGIKILAIDGGGVRGLLAIEVLRAIEAATGKPTHELFDYICGVSTGSILAFLIGAYRKPLDECETLYSELSREIFSQNTLMGAGSLVWSHAYYNTPAWEKILKKHLGEKKLISLAKDPTLPRVGAISTVVSNERVTPYVFRTYTFPPGVSPKYNGGCRYEMWEAVRASAAAPTYFEEVKLGNHLHQDGGVLVNNPSSIALTEARTIWKDTPLQCIVSLGTGMTLSSLTQEAIGDQFCSHTGQDTPDGKAIKQPSSLSWKGKLLKVLDSATDTEAIHYTLRELLPPEVYFRFNPYLSEVIGLDESEPAKLQKAQAEAKAYVEKNILKVNSLKKALLKGKGVTKTVQDWWKY